MHQNVCSKFDDERSICAQCFISHFTQARVCFQEGVKGDLVETSPSAQAVYHDHCTKCIQPPVKRLEGRVSYIWLFNRISWEALKILMPGPTLQNCDLTSLGCSQLFGISESSPSGWRCSQAWKPLPTQSKDGSWTHTYWELIKNINWSPYSKLIVSELWEWTQGKVWEALSLRDKRIVTGYL